MDQQLEDVVAQWRANGVVVLRGFYGDAEIDAALADYRSLWEEGCARVTVDDMDTGQRMRLCDIPHTARREHRFKVNDLYLDQASVRHLALNERLMPLLCALLGERPALCNSLSLEYGTEQPDHVDSLYMTPRTPSDLIASWVAMEDCEPDAGLLRYWPGSHTIEPYVFSNGERHYVQEEMDAWNSYIRAHIQQRGLRPELFHARKGDVFIWSSHLLHGGSPITRPGSTRRSTVFHYFSERDSRAIRARLVPDSGGFWIKRSYQPVPGSLRSYLHRQATRARRALRMA